MNFFSSLVNYLLRSYLIYLLVFCQTFSSFKQTKLDQCLRFNLPLTEQLPVTGIL